MKDRPKKRQEISHPEVSLYVPAGEKPTKRQVRYSILAKRDEIPYSEVLSLSLSVREYVRAWAPFRNAECVCSYLSIRSEMPTPGIILRAIEGGKRVIVPKVMGKNIRFFRIRSLTDDLVRGTFGVLEPLDSCEEVPATEANVCLIPGIAFDKSGNRIGYGKGYYDRFLSTLPHEIPTLGLAYDCQVLDSIPAAPTDVPVQYLVTPSQGVFAAGKTPGVS